MKQFFSFMHACRGLIRNVQQIGIEMHWVENYPQEYARIVQHLYREGFKIISWDPNLHVGKRLWSNYFGLFEVVFRRTVLDCAD